MANKRAKVLTDHELDTLMEYVAGGRHPQRDQAILALSYKAGLRANEIAGLRRTDTMTPNGEMSHEIFIGAHISKNNRERVIPMHPIVKDALVNLYAVQPESESIAYSPYGRTDAMTPNALTVMLHRLYDSAKLEGCSSHSGRRTFITKTPRSANLVGCSLKDVQSLAGHADLRTTERYIELSDQVGELVNAA